MRNTKTMFGWLLMTLVSFATPVLATEPSTWPGFSNFHYHGRAAAGPADGQYANPVIAGFYPDPSVCRVGDDYYLVNSSFQYFPGLPVWHSKDLVHWTQIGNVIDRPSQYRMKGGAVQAGLYAPTIRHHDGTFYVICTLVGGLGNIYVTAESPAGPWSDPIALPNVHGIDPSFFFDNDGKCYVTNCDEPVGPALYTGHRTTRLQEVDLKKGSTVGEQTVLVNGGTDLAKKPIWCEGPHLYKVGGTYYLMAAEGGTGPDHSEVVFRSDALRGPYLPWEKNPILTARDLPPNRDQSVTCTGHADLVQTQGGEWFACFLGCEPYANGFYNTGRQTFLLPVIRQDGWPTILPPRTPVPLSAKRAQLAAEQPESAATTGDIDYTAAFDRDTLDFRWAGLRAPESKWFALSKADKTLRLQPRTDLLSGEGNPSFLAVRQQNNTFTCSVTLTAPSGEVDCAAGLAVFQNEGHFYAMSVTAVGGHLAEIALEQSEPTGLNRGRSVAPVPPKVLARQPLAAGITAIELKIEGDGPQTRFFYKANAGAFRPLGQAVDSSFLSTATAGGFQGVTLGLFAHE